MGKNSRIKIGDKIGKLTIIGEAPRKKGRRRVKAQCSCDGNIKEYYDYALKVENGTTSCGCLWQEFLSKLKQIVGKTINNKKIIEDLGKDEKGRRLVKCIDKENNEKILLLRTLKKQERTNKKENVRSAEKPILKNLKPKAGH